MISDATQDKQQTRQIITHVTEASKIERILRCVGDLMIDLQMN